MLGAEQPCDPISAGRAGRGARPAPPFRAVAVTRRWLTPAVVELAQAAHTDSAFDSLPILADALEEAGCADPELLGHLRSPGPHVRGCWALDLIFGKE